MKNYAQKKEFLRAVASYLVDGQARKGIELDMGKDWAKEWALVRGLSPVYGYPTVDEAHKSLLEMFGMNGEDAGT